MLSLRGVPLRREGDVEELEEGEACPDEDGDDDDETFFDPDVALSYIDEKLQHVLGHFQKDFEGGVSAQNLGSKFGEYGSFLPTYQRSPPPVPQTRSPHKVANISTSSSPYRPSAERMDQDPSTVAVEPISQNSNYGMPSTGDLCKKERLSSTNGEESVAGSDSLDSSFSGCDSKAVKIQTKVGSNKAVPRKNGAIYSGLGLDISSSSSMEESPGGLGGLSPEFSNVPYESPRTILQVMTCFPVPGGFLLSPLHGNVLQLTNKVAPLLKKWETNLDIENVPRAFNECLPSYLASLHVRSHAAEQMKSGSKKNMSIDTKTRKDKGNASAVVNKEVNIEIPANLDILPNMPARTTELRGESHFALESTRTSSISRPPQQNEDLRLKEQIGSNDLAAVKTEAMKAEVKARPKKFIENSGFDNSGAGYLIPKGKLIMKTSEVDVDLEERDMSNHKSSSFDMKRKGKEKPESKFEAGTVDFEGNEDKNKGSGIGPCDDLRNVPVKETFSSNRTGDDNYRTGVKRVHMERQVNAAASCDFLEDDNCTHSSATVIDRRNDTDFKYSNFDEKAKPHKDLSENLPNRDQEDTEGVLLENRSAQRGLQQKEKMMNNNKENEFDVGSARKEIPTTVKHKQFPVSEEQLHLASTSGVATTNAISVPAPIVAKNHWVCCDICQKWRVLPYGTKPSMLPKKWKCTMLYWQPGMNRCVISEDEATDALNALYVIPAPATGVSSGGPHTAGAGTATSNTYNTVGQLEQSRKRKIAPSDGNGLIESSYHTPVPIPPMSNQHDPSKNKRTVDGERYNFERDSVRKHELRPASASLDIVSEKQKSKHTNHMSYSDGGDLMERTKAHSKLANKRGIDQDEYKTSKKTKKVDWHSDVERLDSSCKKIVKECEENLPNSIHCISNGSKNERLKEKRSIILKSEEIVSKVDSRPGKAQHADTVLSSSAGRLNHGLVSENKFVTGKEAPSELWENLPPRQALDLAEHTRRDVAYLQSSAAAASSSSKISCSRRNKNTRETKDSPVESVSSSPLRNFKIETLSRARKDGMTNAYFGSTHSPVKYPNIEVGVIDNAYQAGNFEESQTAGKPIIHVSLQGSSDSKYKEIAQSACAKVSNISHLERGLDNNQPKASWRKDLTVNDTGVGRGNRQLYSSDKKGLDMKSHPLQPSQHLFERRATALDTESNPVANKIKNIAPHQGSASGHQLGMSFGKEKPTRIDNKDIQKPVAQLVSLPMKEGKQVIYPTSEKSDSSKMKTKLMRSNVEKGVQHGTVKQAISNPSDESPLRNDGSMVAFALKEARDLKHKANHLKNMGQELESTGLYFEAALKFLHVAFLMETPSFDISRPGNATQSTKVYSETAKLCNFCANEYERCNKMAAAALAYKCVEVAYLKAAYYKHPSASKDRQELQAAVQIAPGESPSSSASDIDNVNRNSRELSKAPSTKDENSPQVAGNYLHLAIHNQAHLLRLLAYMNDVNSAFNATRKSEIAIASAASSQDSGKDVDDGLALVKTVLNFNFNNVNELLRLVRLSMESISSSCVQKSELHKKCRPVNS